MEAQHATPVEIVQKLLCCDECISHGGKNDTIGSPLDPAAAVQERITKHTTSYAYEPAEKTTQVKENMTPCTFVCRHHTSRLVKRHSRINASALMSKQHAIGKN
jgi:hypothetical protein